MSTNPFDSINNLFNGGDDGGQVEMPDIDTVIPWLNLQQDTLIDSTTPYGTVTHDTVYDEPLSYDDWFSGQDASLWTTPTTSTAAFEDLYPNAPIQNSKAWYEDDWNNIYQGYLNTTPTVTGGPSDPLTMYDQYVADFDPGLGTTTTNVDFSPEVQGLWDTVWAEDSYDSYEQDYMDRYGALLDPYRSMELDSFSQDMADRGLPEGGDIYSDLYTTMISDPNSREDVMAASYAAAEADNARLNDLNALAQAFGMTTGVDVPYIDVMSPTDMAFSTDLYNSNQSSQQSSDFWNNMSLLGSGWLSTF